MEIDSTIVKVQQNHGEDLNGAHSDFIPSISTSKLIKSCIECIGALIQHVENVVSKSNGFIVVNNSLKANSTDGNDIDIVEYSVKQDPDDNASRYLRSIKKSVLQLCLLCVEQNIHIICDLSFKKIDFYSCLDDSTRSLVVNYLTENIEYIVQHIGFIISLFYQEKDRVEAKDIRKSLQKIYKQIILIPLNPNLDETPEVFHNLDSSQWYSESIQNLEEKLSLLRTILIKFKKIFKTTVLSSKSAAKKIKLDNGVSSNHAFLVPDIPHNQVKSYENNVVLIESDTESIKQKKRHGNSKNDTGIIEGETESLRKKNKNKIRSENDKSDPGVIESDTESLRKKKKYKNITENDKSDPVIIESDTESLRKKKKQKIKTENDRSDPVIIESDTESLRKKKKYKNITENDKSDPVIIESDTESLREKKKHKIKTENDRSDSVIIESDTESLRKKRKYKNITENDKSDPVIIESDTESMRKKKKYRAKSETSKNDTNSEISEVFVEDTEFIKNEKNHKYKEQNNHKTKSKKKSSKNVDEDISHDIFSALSNGELEVEYEDNAENLYKTIIRENNLNENEKFLYLQDLLLEAKENDQLSPEMQKKLTDLTVMINWDIPPIHLVESRLSAGPLPEELAQLEALGFSTMRYNRSEDKTIRKNWEEFCKLHNLDGTPTPFLSLRHEKQAYLKYEERKKFVQFLGKGLSHRCLNSIYRRFKVLYRNRTKQGRFDEKEDELILAYCSKINSDHHRFAALATILKRTRASIEQRYRNLTRKYNERMRWSLDVIADLVNNLLETIGSKDLQDLKHAKLNSKHYQKVANVMHIPWEKIRHQWLKCSYTKLFATETLHTDTIRLKLIQLLIDSGETDWNNIKWNEIVTNFPGFSKEFLWCQIMVAVHKVVPRAYYKDLGKVLKCLQTYIEKNKNTGKPFFSNRIIPRYRMTENGIEAFD